MQVNSPPNPRVLQHSYSRFLQKFAEDRFTALDVGHAGKLPIVAVRTFVRGVCPGTEQQASVCLQRWVACLCC